MTFKHILPMTLTALALSASSTANALECAEGKPCGDTCIDAFAQCPVSTSAGMPWAGAAPPLPPAPITPTTVEPVTPPPVPDPVAPTTVTPVAAPPPPRPAPSPYGGPTPPTVVTATPVEPAPAPPAAQAPTPIEETSAEKPVKMNAVHIGLGNHTGGLGLAYTRRIDDRFAVGLGVGQVGLATFARASLPKGWFGQIGYAPIDVKKIDDVGTVVFYGPDVSGGWEARRSKFAFSVSLGIGSYTSDLHGSDVRTTGDVAMGYNF